MKKKRDLSKSIKQLSEWDVDVVQKNQDTSTRAMIYVEEYSLSHSMELSDALIAATCVNNSEILLTANDKHYKFIPNIQVKKFNP